MAKGRRDYEGRDEVLRVRGVGAGEGGGVGGGHGGGGGWGGGGYEGGGGVDCGEMGAGF